MSIGGKQITSQLIHECTTSYNDSVSVNAVVFGVAGEEGVETSVKCPRGFDVGSTMGRQTHCSPDGKPRLDMSANSFRKEFVDVGEIGKIPQGCIYD